MAALILPSRRVVQPQDVAAVDLSFSPQWLFVPQSKSIDLAGSKAVTYKGAATYGAAGSARFINLAAGQSVYSASAVSPGSDFILVVQYRNTSALSDCFLFCAKADFFHTYGFYVSIKGANSLEISPGGGTYPTATVSGVGSASVDVKTLVFHFRGATLRIYSKGVLAATVSLGISTGAWTTGVALNGYTNAGSSSGSQAIGYSLAAVVRNGDPAALSLNPWQLFKPVERRIWVPVSTGGGQTISPPVLTRTKTLHGPSISPGSVDLAPSLVTRSKVLYEPSVSQGGAEQIIVPGLLTRTKTIPSPVVVPGEVDLAPSLLTRTKTIHGPSVSTGATVAPPLLTHGKTLYPPTVSVGGVQLSPSLLVRSKVIHFPSIEGGDAPIATDGLFWPIVRRRRR